MVNASITRESVSGKTHNTSKSPSTKTSCNTPPTYR